MWKLTSVVKEVDLEAMPTSIFLNDDVDDESFRERKFHGAKVLRTWAKVRYKYGSWVDPYIESSICGLFAPGNESAEEHEVQIADTVTAPSLDVFKGGVLEAQQV